MSDDGRAAADDVDAEEQRVDDAMRAVFDDVVREHQASGQPLVIWRDGRVVLVPADQFIVADPHAGPAA
jgi:hypothetical protein